MNGGRLFVHAKTDPHALVPSITKVIRNLASDQPVERAATLEDVFGQSFPPKITSGRFGESMPHAVRIRARQAADAVRHEFFSRARTTPSTR